MTTPPAVPPQAPLPPARVITPPAGDRRSVARSRRRRVLVIALALVLVAGIGFALLRSGSRGPVGADRYSTVKAERGSVTQRVITSGTVAEVNELSVRFPETATVTELRAAVGDTVATGDVLAVIDDTALRTKVLAAQAAVDAAALSLQQIKSASSAGGAGGSGVPAPPVAPIKPLLPVLPAGPVGGAPVPPPPPLPEAPDPSVDLTGLEQAQTAANAAASVVAERMKDADAAITAMQAACRPVAPTPTAAPTPTPTPSASATPTPSASATPQPSASPTPEPTADPSPSATPTSTPSADPTPTIDVTACQAAVDKVAQAQAAVSQAQAAAVLANGQGPEAVHAAGSTLAGAVATLQGWAQTITRALTDWQELVARVQASSGQPSGSGSAPSWPTGTTSGEASGGGGSVSMSRSEIVQAEVALAKARRELASAQEQLGAATMRAPMAGTVSALPWSVGSTANPTDRAVVTAPGAVTVTVTIPTADFLAVKPGQQATVRAAGGVEAVATVASKALIPNSQGSFPVTILTTGQNAEGLAGGSSATVEIGVSSASDVVVVPLSAVRRAGAEGTVRKLAGDEAVEVPVKLGSVGDTHVEVIEGVDIGDVLVVADSSLPLPGLDFGGPG